MGVGRQRVYKLLGINLFEKKQIPVKEWIQRAPTLLQSVRYRFARILQLGKAIIDRIKNYTAHERDRQHALLELSVALAGAIGVVDKQIRTFARSKHAAAEMNAFLGHALKCIEATVNLCTDNMDANYCGVTRSPGTINRYLSVLRQIMKHAAEMRDPLTRQAVLETMPVVRDMKETKRRARPTPEPVLQRLLELLPEHAQDAVILTLFFGFRLGEAFSLQQRNVDWEAAGIRLYAEDVKDNEDAFLPGSQEAMGYLRCLSMEAEKRGVRHLLTFRQSDKTCWRPMVDVRTSWSRAMDIVEKETGNRWRWHDLRAAYITHVALTSGAVTAQTMARHSNFDTTRAYIDVADEGMRIAAERTAQRPALQIVRRGATLERQGA